MFVFLNKLHVKRHILHIFLKFLVGTHLAPPRPSERGLTLARLMMHLTIGASATNQIHVSLRAGGVGDCAFLAQTPTRKAPPLVCRPRMFIYDWLNTRLTKQNAYAKCASCSIQAVSAERSCISHGLPISRRVTSSHRFSTSREGARCMDVKIYQDMCIIYVTC